jgi:acetolactate synthase-1/2/3 large subunit
LEPEDIVISDVGAHKMWAVRIGTPIVVLREALDHDGVSVIDCPVDYGENLKLTEKLGQLVCPI